VKWTKMGRIFRPESNDPWVVTHVTLPTPDKISDNVLRINFSTRSKDIKSATTFLEVNADDPSRVLYVHDKPVLFRGKLGTFDDGGVSP